MTSKPPIPYYPDWKLEKALENNLLLYRIFERRVLFYRNVTRIPRYGVKIWMTWWRDIGRRLGKPGREIRNQPLEAGCELTGDIKLKEDKRSINKKNGPHGKYRWSNNRGDDYE